MCWRPATGGFLTTLTATIILIVVCFNVPYFKTVYFLRATYNSGGQGGYISFGTLGYCLSVNGNETCTKPSIGYEFNPNTLLGNNTQLQIPTVVAKWLTYALFLHVIALGLAGVSAIFGLLAHIREFSMTCFSSCISGAAAAICLIAFIFDLVLFFVAKARIQSIDGATAIVGNAIWLTLAAWILLFISGCAFGLGRCCIARRPRTPAGSKASAYAPNGNATLPPDPNAAYAEQMRMDAIKAEVDRKARQKAGTTHEVGLPAFESFEEYETRPLTSEVDTPAHSPYRDQPSPANNRFGAAGAATGYVPASSLQTPPRRQASAASTATHNNGGRSPPPAGYGNSYGHGGRRTTDPSHGSTYPPNTTYPPQQNLPSTNFNPARESSLAERDIYASAGLTAPAAATAAAVGVGAAAAASRNDYLQPNTAQHGRGDSYGHHSQASSYHSAYSHQQYGSHYQDPSTAASQYNYGASNQPYDQAAAYGQSRSPPLPGGYPAGGHSQYPSQQSTYPPQNYSQQQTYPPQPSQNAYDPYGDSYDHPGTTPTPGAYPPQQSYTPQPQPQTPYSQPQTPYSPHHQSSYPLPSQPMVGGSNPQQDLNFPGVAVPSPQHQPATYASSPEPINTQLPYGAQAAGSSAGAWATSPGRGPRSPHSPTRLAAWQEESEPSTVGPSTGRPHIPEDAPPDYETSTVGSRNAPYQNEKQTYRPQ